MYQNPEGIRRRIYDLAQVFRQKGATSPEKAMTIQELGLGPRFEQAMHRRLGQTGIFVEVNGKYYLDEARFKQFQERTASMPNGSSGGGGWNGQGRSGWSRYLGILLMLPLGIIIGLVLIYYFFYVAGAGAGYFPGEVLLILLVVWIVLFVVRLLFWRRRRF